MASDTVTVAPGASQSTLTLENASQAKDLDDLAGVGASIDNPGGAPGAAAPAGTGLAPAQNPLALANAGVIEGAISAGVKGFCTFTKLHAPRLVATDAVIRDQAQGWGTWCAVRGIDLKTYMGNHADTIPLVVSTALLAFAVYEATRQEISQRKPVEAESKPVGEGSAS